MIAVAFLQNQWLKNPDSARALIEKHGDKGRDRLTKYALFAGCVSGRRIKAAFGDLIDGISWHEASPVITATPRACPPADLGHIMRSIDRLRPDVIIAFGKIASDALRIVWKGPLIVGPHPAARFDTSQPLMLMRLEYERALATRERPT